MIVLEGKCACGGIAFGTLRFFRRVDMNPAPVAVGEPELEIARYVEARMAAATQLDGLYQKALAEMGEDNALLFEIHKMMLDDEDFTALAEETIREKKVCAEYAVRQAGEHFARMFAEMEDPYMQGRAADVRDITGRLLAVLGGKGPETLPTGEPMILAADDLVPSETVQLDKQYIRSIVTAEGSVSSHTAIFARTMGIPAIIGIGLKLDAGMEGKAVAVDAEKGLLYIEPNEETIKLLEKKRQEEQKRRALLEQLKGKPNRTRDGRAIEICANIGHPSHVEAALQNDAGGIGLFRTEFLYLERDDYPDEETQFAAYRSVVEQMGRKVIFRTLDIGADKQAAYFNLPQEENPALGMRAIRICLTRPELLKTQLRALYRASAYGKLAVMFPMIVSQWELRRCKELAAEVREELREKHIPFSLDVELGIMIETPAAALISDLLAQEADFFSIGTNDLTQYTLAIDRQSRVLDEFCDTHHQAVLRLICMTCQNAKASGIWTGICGELAADFSLTAEFLSMGIQELSVSPDMVLPLRKHIRSL